MSLISAIKAYAPIPKSEPSKVSSSSGRKQESAKTLTFPKDSVEISSEAQNRLARIQHRIQAGYYNSSAIAEDISDKLTKVLNEMH